MTIGLGLSNKNEGYLNSTDTQIIRLTLSRQSNHIRLCEFSFILNTDDIVWPLVLLKEKHENKTFTFRHQRSKHQLNFKRILLYKILTMNVKVKTKKFLLLSYSSQKTKLQIHNARHFMVYPVKHGLFSPLTPKIHQKIKWFITSVS